MVYLENYEFFVDKRTSKNNKEYYGLFIKIDNEEQLVCFITSSLYNKICNLSS